MEEIKVKKTGIIKLQSIKDGFDGVLSIAECGRQIPFDVKRTYYIYNLINHRDVIRGKHAHKSLKQVIFCINGSFVLSLDDGTNKQEIVMDDPTVGVYLGPELWHTMTNFKNNCIMLVLASDWYNESDYIRDYEEFLQYIKR
ncbi:MAG TPA: fatty-acid oxidation protein subunit alpha [Candidatus Magasanikbacteria bacterium]|nr:MAG: fatty-acid oxidation protein subunit alpha [Candidatus Magasanikbacteria bacterium RIFOXYC2_FULL_39_8]HAT03317.1 fatty-acid oxidation protein subunit alpha [Candidatus Magasanikbacteria bacterium]